MAVKSGQINGKSQHKGVEKAMSKPRKKQGNPDFRHRVSVPAPGSKEIESRLFELISLGIFTNLKGVKDKEQSLRSRVLTLPVMAAIVLSLVYRQVQHLTDVLRSLSSVSSAVLGVSTPAASPFGRTTVYTQVIRLPKSPLKSQRVLSLIPLLNKERDRLYVVKSG
ncbi:hypothetical protein [Nostoc sp.]|uniref:hypothetical protein n=1 Tax=Nostoc sp. TaxID=1180 RepID=UPI002FF605DA